MNLILPFIYRTSLVISSTQQFLLYMGPKLMFPRRGCTGPNPIKLSEFRASTEIDEWQLPVKTVRFCVLGYFRHQNLPKSQVCVNFISTLFESPTFRLSNELRTKQFYNIPESGTKTKISTSKLCSKYQQNIMRFQASIKNFLKYGNMMNLISK